MLVRWFFPKTQGLFQKQTHTLTVLRFLPTEARASSENTAQLLLRTMLLFLPAITAHREVSGIAVRLAGVSVLKKICTRVRVTRCAVHAEMNALLNCSRQQTIGADLYLAGVNPEDNSVHQAKPCPLCARVIIQAGIRNVYLRAGEGADNYIVVPADELEWLQGDDK